MSETVFCYACRTHHPKEHMSRFETRCGTRWRCRESIRAAKGSIEERDAFGRKQTGMNREASLAIAQQTIALRHHTGQ